jgi:dihydrodipicolinate synthase/N-acetylneuraminate lyase
LEITKSNKSGNVIVPLITPRCIEDFYALIEHVLAGGVSDLLLFGTTGEGSKISLAQKKWFIARLAPFIAERARFYVGLLEPNPAANAELAAFCRDYHFAGGLVPIHSLQSPRRAQLPLILYLVPGSTPTVADIKRLKSDNVIGIKDSSSGIESLQMMIHELKSNRFKVYYGRERQMEEALKMDIDGFFPASANIAPGLLMKLWQKKDEESLSAFAALKEQIRKACPESYIEGIKSVLKEMKVVSK